MHALCTNSVMNGRHFLGANRYSRDSRDSRDSRELKQKALSPYSSDLGITILVMTLPISSCVASILLRTARIVDWPNWAVRTSSVSHSFNRPPKRPRSPLIRANSRTCSQSTTPLDLVALTNLTQITRSAHTCLLCLRLDMFLFLG